LFLSRLEELERRVGDELARPIAAKGPIQELAVDVAREVWRVGLRGAATLLRRGAVTRSLALALASARTNDLGVDEQLGEGVRELIRPFARYWLGMDVTTARALPHEGAVLVTLNRSAWPLPVDALILWSVLSARAGARRDVYVLWESDQLELPFLGDALQRIGVVAASADNARILLERGAMVISFPEGAAARGKTYERRYRLERFDDRFLVNAAMAAGARIVPGALVGNEESYPMLGTVRGIPITPIFPLLGVAGMWPLPLTWRIRLGSPIEYAEIADRMAERGRLDPAESDGVEDVVRARMQAMLGEMLAERRSILLG
jgi:1-acyl-sn-glycerol-3-phosphate acyltransferase